ncbi:TRAP transporter small permease [Rhodobacteraceae bacterium NNCM2]|nr:TRAP transporter small permease [Coraliihabitans acroporae]
MSALISLVRILGALNNFLTTLGMWIASALLGLMAILVATQVFFRYVLNNSLAWAEDLSLMMLVISTFLIVPYAYRWSLHVGIDLVVELFPARVRYCFYLVSGVIILILSLYFIEVSWDLTQRSTINADAVPIKMKYVYAVLPVSFVLLIPNVVELLLRSLIGVIDPTNKNASLSTEEVAA